METNQIISWLRDKACRAENQSWTRMMNKAADRLRELDQEQKWIPVTERLPEKSTSVIAFRKAKYLSVLCYSPELGFHSYDSECGDVTHWRPLPEPPKEVE